MIHRITADAITKAVALGLESMRAEPVQWLSDWAQENFVLAGDSSHQKGRWNAWAFQIGIMDFMSDDRIEELNIRKSKRVGYSKMLVAWVTYNIAHRRRKVAMWQPTDDDRDSFVKTEIDPALDSIPAVAKARKSYGTNKDTMAYKSFRDAVLHILGGKAARAYRRITVDGSALDEWDGFDRRVEKSGTARVLAKGRLEGAPYPKFIGGTTPRVKGLSNIEEAEKEANVLMQYHIDCPHCGVEHPLIWGGKKVTHGFKWERGRPETVRHVCPHCHESITQADYLPGGVPLTGTWISVQRDPLRDEFGNELRPADPGGLRYGADRIWRDALGNEIRPPRHVAVHVWSAYSPQRTWVDIARECEEAATAYKAGNDGPMQGFVNETLGDVYELKGATTSEHMLQRRAREARPPHAYTYGRVPVGCLTLTAAVDTQDDRLEWSVWGWGRGLQSWLIAKGKVQGSPAEDETWLTLEMTLAQVYPTEWGGAPMTWKRCAIDIQGHHTQAVYNFVRGREHLGYRAVRGSNDDTAPVKGTASAQDVDVNGRKVKRGVMLWEVGVHAAKDLFHSQRELGTPGPGYVNLPANVEFEVCEQLTAEQRVLVNTSVGTRYRWVKRRARNEQLDMRNYALWGAYDMNLHLYEEAHWARLEAKVQPKKIEQEDGTVVVQPVIEQKPKPAPRAPARPQFQRAW